MNKFIPTSAWRKRKNLASVLEEIQDLAESANRTFELRLFDKDNFPWTLRQLERKIKQARNYYNKHK